MQNFEILVGLGITVQTRQTMDKNKSQSLVVPCVGDLPPTTWALAEEAETIERS